MGIKSTISKIISKLKPTPKTPTTVTSPYSSTPVKVTTPSQAVNTANASTDKKVQVTTTVTPRTSSGGGGGSGSVQLGVGGLSSVAPSTTSVTGQVTPVQPNNNIQSQVPVSKVGASKVFLSPLLLTDSISAVKSYIKKSKVGEYLSKTGERIRDDVKRIGSPVEYQLEQNIKRDTYLYDRNRAVTEKQVKDAETLLAISDTKNTQAENALKIMEDKWGSYSEGIPEEKYDAYMQDFNATNKLIEESKLAYREAKGSADFANMQIDTQNKLAKNIEWTEKKLKEDYKPTLSKVLFRDLRQEGSAEKTIRDVQTGSVSIIGGFLSAPVEVGALATKVITATPQESAKLIGYGAMSLIALPVNLAKDPLNVGGSLVGSFVAFNAVSRLLTTTSSAGNTAVNTALKNSKFTTKVTSVKNLKQLESMGYKSFNQADKMRLYDTLVNQGGKVDLVTINVKAQAGSQQLINSYLPKGKYDVLRITANGKTNYYDFGQKIQIGNVDKILKYEQVKRTQDAVRASGKDKIIQEIAVGDLNKIRYIEQKLGLKPNSLSGESAWQLVEAKKVNINTGKVETIFGVREQAVVGSRGVGTGYYFKITNGKVTKLTLTTINEKGQYIVSKALTESQLKKITASQRALPPASGIANKPLFEFTDLYKPKSVGKQVVKVKQTGKLGNIKVFDIQKASFKVGDVKNAQVKSAGELLFKKSILKVKPSTKVFSGTRTASKEIQIFTKRKVRVDVDTFSKTKRLTGTEEFKTIEKSTSVLFDKPLRRPIEFSKSSPPSPPSSGGSTPPSPKGDGGGSLLFDKPSSGGDINMGNLIMKQKISQKMLLQEQLKTSATGSLFAKPTTSPTISQQFLQTKEFTGAIFKQDLLREDLKIGQEFKTQKPLFDSNMLKQQQILKTSQTPILRTGSSLGLLQTQALIPAQQILPITKPLTNLKPQPSWQFQVPIIPPFGLGLGEVQVGGGEKGQKKSTGLFAGTIYNPSLGSILLRRKPTKVTKAQAKALARRTYTGLELRPEIQIEENKPKKRVSLFSI